MTFRNTAAAVPLAILFMLPVSQLWAQEANYSIQTSKGSTLDVFSQLNPVVINRIHSWELALTGPDESPVTGAEIFVTGGMPDHDHGLPTLPIVTRETSPGRYLLEGVRFHMPGRWQLTVTINSPQGDEIGLLDFEL
ncbi:MAG TPA: Auxin-binding protein [Gammaproteobacteria bacterium]|jgi:hypothetical protein|uniref:Auxin-binding protein n=1 Tax=OM182 bacterium TaxID=2510334 RepID=A0A520RWE6_9GAMM|nr:Auxin-binding protein [Gammaproteobacteria bacterium]RZO74556.1 MAG: Auxin-binding protein [OM182 bacterium]HAU23728.1 Auxin-binding protein [Gammaproteobacteria bacterium]HBJ90349.1 Auxin-binding protein [Gammaproteobacteria bacterium]HBQ01116.1 Auxin-binding protein [Gammaproteobacteria bacterium]|tara:strand:+ start:2063 stop:2473 length:411 start_codon:yes stop_codon:yes gene_type:complete